MFSDRNKMKDATILSSRIRRKVCMILNLIDSDVSASVASHNNSILYNVSILYIVSIYLIYVKKKEAIWFPYDGPTFNPIIRGINSSSGGSLMFCSSSSLSISGSESLDWLVFALKP